MIKSLASLFALFLFTLPISAQTIEVLSGEHEDFSRLVMQFPEPVDWVFGRSEEGYEFYVPDTAYTFDLGQVFQRIPRARIQAVRTQEARISLVVSDHFHADVFELREGRLVIDIKDGAPSDASPYEMPFHREGLDARDQNPKVESAQSLPISLETATTHLDLMSEGEGDRKLGRTYADDLTPLDASAPLALPLVPSRTADEKEQQVFLDEDDVPGASSRIENLEQQLLEQIGRAVSQGMLEPDVTKTEKIVEQATSYADVPSEPLPPTEPDQIREPQVATGRQSHMRIQSALAQKKEGQNRNAERADAYGTLCLDDDLLNISTWGQALEEGLQISEFRKGTVGEFDEPNADGVRNLAKYYLYLTFGAEATSVLTNFDLRSDEDGVLLAMAEIMDRGYATVLGTLSTQFRCDGQSAFWSVMGKREFLPSEDLNLESILATFSALPLHMRRHLGPTLSERFLAAGDEKTAKSLQNAIARAEGDHGDAFDLLDAELSMMDGKAREAEIELEQLITEDGPEAARALVKLIEYQAARGQGIERRLAEVSEAMMVEFRDDEFETDLQDAAILARIYSGDVDIALKRSLRRSMKQDVDFIAQALNVLYAQSDDTKFSKIILGNLAGLTQANIPEAERINVVSRLMDLGFYQEALKLMAGSSQKEDDASRLILAKAFYSLGEMDAALRYASQIPTEEAAEIASKAHFYKNDPNNALTVAKNAGLVDGIGTYALVAEDWESLAGAGAGALSALAEAVTGYDAQSPRESNQPETLGELRNELAASQKLRAALASIIN